MKVFCHCTLLLILFITISFNISAQQTSTQKWTGKTAKKWVKSGVWRNGVSLKPHSSINDIEFAQQYEKNKEGWDKAFLFLSDSKLDTLSPCIYVIDGPNVYATITNVPSKEFDQSAWESHRNYIDLQYVIKGKEKIGVAPIGSATVIKPYDAAKDAANYTAEGKYYIATPDEFFLFFPGDAHRPNIKVAGYDTIRIKKLVIKIRYIN